MPFARRRRCHDIVNGAHWQFREIQLPRNRTNPHAKAEQTSNSPQRTVHGADVLLINVVAAFDVGFGGNFTRRKMISCVCGLQVVLSPRCSCIVCRKIN